MPIWNLRKVISTNSIHVEDRNSFSFFPCFLKYFHHPWLVLWILALFCFREQWTPCPLRVLQPHPKDEYCLQIHISKASSKYEIQAKIRRSIDSNWTIEKASPKCLCFGKNSIMPNCPTELGHWPHVSLQDQRQFFLGIQAIKDSK